MKNFNTIIILILIAFIYIGCSKSITTNAYKVTGNKMPTLFEGTLHKEYETKHLNEVQVAGKSIFGIPINTNKQRGGFIVKVNGIDLGVIKNTPKILPILTLVVYSLGCQYGIQQIFGKQQITSHGITKDGDFITDVPTSYLLGLPIAVTLNTLTWPNSSISSAIPKLNYELINQNQDIDFFYMPKYEFEKKGFFFTNSILKAKFLGASLKTTK